MTTIAWRIGHIGLTFIGFGDRLFADGKVTLDDVDFVPSAEAAVAFLNDTYRTYWRDRIDGLDEAVDGGARSGPRSARTPTTRPPTSPSTCSTNWSTTARRSGSSATSTCGATCSAPPARSGRRPVGPGW
ncbi:DinB family protein [Actinomadura barringtoniae]|uniref:DinB family protein n=1 Tax=Actinomadura barringtoniae TaxID=1427535 RepID=A0A939PKF2_9ACTN|nr:DinB family protein [Actinomadura barringtoniae]MBO2454557.1 DinB family protein [Actinomadura barringtoniae]